MSIKAMNWAWHQAGMNGGEKLVLLALADHADNDGYCWPGTRGIAEKCSISRPTLNKHLHMLQDFKLLCVEPRTDGAGRTISNGYQLHLLPQCGACKGVFTGSETQVDRLVTPGCPEPSPEPTPEPTSPGEGFATEVASPSPAPLGAKRKDMVGMSVKRVQNPFQDPFTDDDRERLIAKYAASLPDAGFNIDQALNHIASRKAINLYKYVDGWLRREAKRPLTGGSKRTGNSAPAPATRPKIDWTKGNSPPLPPERVAAARKLNDEAHEKERQRVAKATP